MVFASTLSWSRHGIQRTGERNLEKGTLGWCLADPSALRDRSPILKDSCWEWQPQHMDRCTSADLPIYQCAVYSIWWGSNSNSWSFTRSLDVHLLYFSMSFFGEPWCLLRQSSQSRIPNARKCCTMFFGFWICCAGVWTQGCKHFVTEQCSQHLPYILLRNMVSSSCPSLVFNSHWPR